MDLEKSRSFLFLPMRLEGSDPEWPSKGEFGMHQRILRTSFCAALAFAGLLLGCGGGDSRALAPFTRLAYFSGDLTSVASVRYTIEPKAGSVSSPVDVRYSHSALERRGCLNSASGELALPIFGLYANYQNRVLVQFQFQDGSTQTLPVFITTSPYTAPDALYDHPNILKKRSANSVLGFDFLYIKSGLGSPVVIDTDGEIRWVGWGVTDATSSRFQENAFWIGDSRSATLKRLELDGSHTLFQIGPSTFTNFHHNIDPGKLGMLAEFDATSSGVAKRGSTVAELGNEGTVLKEWDLAALLGSYMKSQGDDPSSFIRPGTDWFHMNSSMYDPSDDSLVVSSRENFVIKLDYQTGSVVWILGDPTKYWYTFPSLRAKALTLEAGGLYPLGQHALSMTADGLLMLFNNGACSYNQPAGAPVGEVRDYSAVSAYAVDPMARTAREVWRFDYGQSILSSICSSAYEASDKSLLVNYAVASDWTKARLVGLDAGHSVIFDFEYPTTPCVTSWNAEPIPFDNLAFE